MKIIWRILAVAFTLLWFGTLSETYRIFTSNDADIANNRAHLIPISITWSVVILGLTILFWRLSRKKRLTN